jgi:hypothetical protein
VHQVPRIGKTHRLCIRYVASFGRIRAVITSLDNGEHIIHVMGIGSRQAWQFHSYQTMKSSALICLFACAVLPVSSDADVQIGKKTVLHLASASEGRRILISRDDFIRRLSPFDRSAILKVDRPVSEEEFLNFVGANVSDWTQEEMDTVQTSLERVQTLLHDLPLPFPATVQLIKTTGAEEGNAAYTRGTAIVIPTMELTRDQKHLEKLICHELFHVLSRQNPELRKRLYAIIGFTECDEIELPRDLASRKITNPDAPRNDHFIRLQCGGRECLAVPILFSNTKVYNVERGGDFFDYLNFQFLVVEKDSNRRRLKVVYENSTPKLVEPQAVSGFFEQVGRNTQYIIHPEEILADNFALLILGEQNAPSPEILQKMKEVLFRKREPEQTAHSISANGNGRVFLHRDAACPQRVAVRPPSF